MKVDALNITEVAKAGKHGGERVWLITAAPSGFIYNLGS